MNVSDLIKKLKELNPNSNVLVLDKNLGVMYMDISIDSSKYLTILTPKNKIWEKR